MYKKTRAELGRLVIIDVFFLVGYTIFKFLLPLFEVIFNVEGMAMDKRNVKYNEQLRGPALSLVTILIFYGKLFFNTALYKKLAQY